MNLDKFMTAARAFASRFWRRSPDEPELPAGGNEPTLPENIATRRTMRDRTDLRPAPTIEQIVKLAARARKLASEATTETARALHVALAEEYEAKAAQATKTGDISPADK